MHREGSPSPNKNGHGHSHGGGVGDRDNDDTNNEDIFINPSDGLRLQAMDEVNYRNRHNNHIRQRLTEIGVSDADVLESLGSLSLEEFFGGGGGDDDNSSQSVTTFPTSLIVTGLEPESFWDSNNPGAKGEFESIFRAFVNTNNNNNGANSNGEPNANMDMDMEVDSETDSGGGTGTGTPIVPPLAFYYFKSFKRVRVDFSSAASCITARIKVHMSRFTFSSGQNESGTCVLKCYFGQPMKSKSKDGFLHPPTPDKQFLISPPASPPVDWEPHPEGHPVLLDYDLISALAKLGPGDSHELHKPESESHPSIVVHIAEEDESEEGRLYKEGLKLLKTGGSGGGAEYQEMSISGSRIPRTPTRRPE